jgi:signal transduction histidine kinase
MAAAPQQPDMLEVLRKSEVERHRLERALRDANRLKSEFFGHISHELSTPLNGIIGFAEFLLEERSGPLTSEQREYVSDILGCGRRLQQLIDGVLELSRLEAGSAEIGAERFVLVGAVEEACTAVAQAAQQKGIGVHRMLAPELHTVALDRRRLVQLLVYLLSSAIKIGAAGCELWLELAPFGDSALRLRVWDSGAAQTSTELDRLLSDYPQLDSSAIRRFGGTGLDLVLAKKLVEAQSGIFGVDHTQGQPPAFSAILPCVLASLQPPEAGLAANS